jgi:hypothetical protein
LGKQRVEAYQILRALTGESKGWINHPAVKMWRGYERALAMYGLEMCNEWIARGYKDSLKPRFLSFQSWKLDTLEFPSWLGGDIHSSHRSNLLRKNKEFYSKYGWTEPDTLAYVWPTEEIR